MNIIQPIYDQSTYLISSLPIIIILNVIFYYIYKKVQDNDYKIADIRFIKIAVNVLLTYLTYLILLIIF